MIDLTQEEIQNLIVFVGRAAVQGQEQDVAVMLKAKLAQALQAKSDEPSRDGAKEEAPVKL